MGWLEALILGIIQGLTEFLPVSSSGHLEITKAIFNNDIGSEQSMFMTVLLHAATALSTIVVFRKEIVEILTGLIKFKNNEETRFSIKIILSMIPAVFVGLYFEKEIEELFRDNIVLVGSMLILTGGLLFLADRSKTTDNGVSFSNAVIIGVSQAIAILPGISRSGATISTSVLLGVDRTKAAKFSFLMVVPLILGKMGKDILDPEFAISNTDLSPMIIGFVAAFVTGLIACTWMIKLVRKSKLSYFAYYCFAVGIISIVFGLGIISF